MGVHVGLGADEITGDLFTPLHCGELIHVSVSFLSRSLATAITINMGRIFGLLSGVYGWR